MTRVQLGEICERLSSGKSIKAVEVQDLGPYPVIGGNGLRGSQSATTSMENAPLLVAKAPPAATSAFILARLI